VCVRVSTVSEDFRILSENTTCTAGEMVHIQCHPAAAHDARYWFMYTDSFACQHFGEETVNGSVLSRPCGSYSLQCVYIADGHSYGSQMIVITPQGDYF